MRDNFISTIVNFDTDDVTEDVRLKMRKYLENPRQHMASKNQPKFNPYSISIVYRKKISIAFFTVL